MSDQGRIRRIQNRLHAAIDAIVEEEGLAGVKIFGLLPDDDRTGATPIEIGQIVDPTFEQMLDEFIVDAVTGLDEPVVTEESPIVPRSHMLSATVGRRFWSCTSAPANVRRAASKARCRSRRREVYVRETG